MKGQYYLYVAIIFFIGLIVFAISVVLKFNKKKKLSESDKKELVKNFGKISRIKGNYKEQIIDYDKLYHKSLLALGYQGNFGEILKKEPNEIGNMQKVWDLHKLRNKLVHDFDILSDAILRKKVGEYEKELKFLIK